MRDEHNFAGRSIEQWNEAVFRAASHFTVVRCRGKGRRDRKDFATFPGAAVEAFHDAAAMVYAVTESGRFVMVPKSEWRRCVDIWGEMHPEAK